MAKPNYAFAKRQRDLLKKQKKEEKRLKKAGSDVDAAPEGEANAQAPVEPSAEDKAGTI